jgi:hypothetical protein
MPLESLGKPIVLAHAEPVQPRGGREPGFGWQISEQTRKDLEAIDANVRKAEQSAGSFIVR